MTQDQILARLNQVFCEIFDDDGITLTYGTSSADIEGWDSLNQIKIILACEKAFRVRLQARDINILEDIGAMVAHLSSLGAKAE